MTHLTAVAGGFSITPKRRKREMSSLNILSKLKVPAIILGVIIFTVLLLGSVIVGITGHYSRIMNPQFTSPTQISQLMPLANNGGNMK